MSERIGVGTFWKKVSRFSDWWSFKISYLLIPFYCLLLEFEGGLIQALLAFFSLLGYFICTAAFGHIINDLSDLKSDLIASKDNASSGLANIRVAAILIALVSISFCFLLIVGADALVYALAGGELLLFCLYSLHPFRFKESYLGLIVDSAYAHVIPFCISGVIMWGYISELSSTYMFLFVVAITWQFFSGLRGIIGHELEDLSNDLASGTSTAVVRMGAGRAERLRQRWIVPVEVSTLILSLGLLVPFLWLPLVGLVSYILWFKWKNHGTSSNNPKHFAWDGFLDLFYRRILPPLVLLGVVLVEPSYWPFLPLHLVLFGMWGIRKMPRSLIDRKLRGTDQSIQIELEGCYLTSLLTTRSDVNIEVSALLGSRKMAPNLQYAPNCYTNFYADKYGIEEQPVCFTMKVNLPKKDGNKGKLEFSIQAELLPADEKIILYRERIRI